MACRTRAPSWAPPTRSSWCGRCSPPGCGASRRPASCRPSGFRSWPTPRHYSRRSPATGVATPRKTRDVLSCFLAEHPAVTLSMHMHDTRGTALANVLVGLELGLRSFDAAIGGLGGCPYAPGAAGNLATEDLVYMLDGM